MRFLPKSVLRAAAPLASFIALVTATPALADPANIVITVPAGAQAPADLADKLSAWRQSGEVSDVLWLDAEQRANPGFATFVQVEFPTETDYEAWVRTNQSKLGAVTVVRVDRLSHGERTPRDSNYSVFKVNEYQPTAPAAATRDFATNYIAPFMESQTNARIMMRHSMYQARQADGKGKTWLVMEYRDPISFRRSEEVKTGLRANLTSSNAGYARLDKVKESLRTTGPETIARYTELPPPSLPDLPGYKPDTKITGTLRVYGSELKNAVEYLMKGFQAFHPNIRISWSNASSSEGGIAGLYTGISDVAPMGDDAKITDMMPFWNTFGYMPTEISVASGGYEKRGSLWAWAIVVNKDNPLNEISVDELTRVFGSERSGGWKAAENDFRFTSEFARPKSTNIRSWGQLGVRGALANKEIQTYGYSAPGFATYFERNWFKWSKKWNSNFMEYVEAKQTTSDDFGLQVDSRRPLEVLSKDTTGIGIAGLMHVKNFPNLKVLRISEKKGEPAIALTPQTVANRSYPLHRDGFFYVNKAPGQPLDPKVREFMRFVLSREGQEIIARVGYYYPLDAKYLAEQRKKLD
ncbi:MAG: ABC-type phosphate transport system substrate-binding protein [Sphingomonas bacterium]|uniref:PstS family phosphate ABC transporter substrate-binding protein n=1 Tax=Sphingomonas bacterium TaxID=1895847 RepID=UPI00262C9633|nr:substrate-binding domain-containing protein [Sphingomonas bacterium]MDB5694807.1 ABC-type phosphate transport system substrate-binding protein [Sphingomonas bacterium]